MVRLLVTRSVAVSTPASFFPDVPRELLRAGFERYQRAGLWTRTTTLSEKGFERLAYSLQLGGFISRRAPYAECVRTFPTARGAEKGA